MGPTRVRSTLGCALERKAADILESELELPLVPVVSPLFSPTFPFVQLKGKILQHCKGVFFLLLSWEYSLDVITALLGIIWGDKFGERPFPPVSALWLPFILSRSLKCYS